MKPKIITLPYSPTLGGFDDEPLTSFVKGKTVLTFREHFFSVNEMPHIVCVLTCQEPIVNEAVDQTLKKQRRSAVPSTDELSAGLAEGDRLVFNAIRSWRSNLAQEEGVPPYVILTNKQLLAIVAQRPESLAALGHVEGIGKKKIERFGAQLLQALQTTTAAPTEEIPS
ncbi:MAG: superfamily II DNA helicase RecQ [Planctomycetota bacterium]|jgi:superfamily II DNA helicase RecQ